MRAILFLAIICLAAPVFAAGQESFTNRDLKKFKYEVDEEQDRQRMDEAISRKKKNRLEAEEQGVNKEAGAAEQDQLRAQKCGDYERQIREYEALNEKERADRGTKARYRSLRLEYIRDCRAGR